TVLGVLDGKDLDGLAAALAEEGDEVIVAAPRSARAAATHDVARALRDQRALAQLAPDVPTAVERAIEQVGDRGLVLVTGSLVTVADGLVDSQRWAARNLRNSRLNSSSFSRVTIYTACEFIPNIYVLPPFR
ncbi:MAG: hypothetical protein P8Y68_14910, partial [Anaerolineales bacterium]